MCYSGKAGLRSKGYTSGLEIDYHWYYVKSVKLFYDVYVW